MTATRDSLPAVTIAGVVAVALGLLGALGSLLAGLSVLVMPRLPQTPGAPPMPQGVLAISAAMMLLLFAVFVFGIFVGVGVIRRRNWARISILIWAGFMTFVCASAMVFGLLIFTAMPMQLPSIRASEMGNVMLFMKIFFVVFYGIPAAIGIWWLVLFTRKRVSDAFTNPAGAAQLVPTLDPSGFPQPAAVAAPPQPARPACPLPLAILAGWFIFSGVCSALFAVVPMPSSMPLYLFGHVYFGGLAPKLFLGLMGLVLGVCGAGILKLQPWGLHTALAVQCVFFVNGLFAVISPTFQTDMQDAMEKMLGGNPAFIGGNPFLSGTYFRSMMVLSLIFAIVMIAILVFQRTRFLEQAEAAART